MSDELTPKQEEAARLHANGASKAEACREAGYAESTAEKQQSRIFAKPAMLEAVSRFRQQLFQQLEAKGMTPERIAGALAQQLDANPLPTIALWAKIVAPNERSQWQVEVNECLDQGVKLMCEELGKAFEKIPENQRYEFYDSLSKRYKELCKEWDKRLSV